MRKLIFIFCLLVSVSAFGQAADTSTGKNTLYIVDGKPDAPGNEVKPADILAVSILNSADAVKLYGKQAMGGATVITSKKYAAAAYQKKLATLSKKYKAYMDEKHNDSNLMYVLNNVIMNQERKSSIQALYELSPDSIAKINFKRQSRFKTDATVEITTKKQN